MLLALVLSNSFFAELFSGFVWAIAAESDFLLSNATWLGASSLGLALPLDNSGAARGFAIHFLSRVKLFSWILDSRGASGSCIVQ